mgnify:CR=1 FL=1
MLERTVMKQKNQNIHFKFNIIQIKENSIDRDK